MLKDNALDMEIIVNNKTFENGLNVIQLETAVGAAMKTFSRSCGELVYFIELNFFHHEGRTAAIFILNFQESMFLEVDSYQ